jgi:hypothetical protein
MLQFEVPQFIDIEDKIIGPFSLKQFGFVGAGTLLDVALFRIFGFSIPFFLFGLPIALLTLAVSFGTFNGRRVYNIFPIFIEFLTSTKVYIYSKQHISESEIDIKPMVLNPVEPSSQDSLEPPQSRLKRLTALLEQKDKEEYQIVNGPRS